MRFYAQPYALDAVGFGFENVAEFEAGLKAARNSFGQPVEEFEIQFIDGEALDAALFRALDVGQADIVAFMAVVDDWSEHDKLSLIFAVGECGYSFEFGENTPDDYDVDIYEDFTLKRLAHHFVDEGLFGEIPSHLEYYIDYDAYARDLGVDYTEAEIGGQDYVYRCA